MKKIVFLLVLILVSIFFLFPRSVLAENTKQFPQDTYYKGEIVGISNTKEFIIDNKKSKELQLLVRITDGAEKGKTITVTNTITQDSPYQNSGVGQEIVVLKTINPATGNQTYSLFDMYRMDKILFLVGLFFLFVFAVARKKGIGAIIGLAGSLFVVLYYIVPQILQGADPLTVSLVGSIIILLTTTFIAHGFSKQTGVALVATLVSLLFTVFLAKVFVDFANIGGVGNEEIASLRMGTTSYINVQGLFLGGIIIGALGALNDITTTQSAAIFLLAKTDKTLSFAVLFQKGFAVGKEHILSLVNTLVLAYVGSSLFVFIFISLNPSGMPYWVIFNTETIADEIIGALVGSSGLILAVPIVTAIAAWVAKNEEKINLHKHT